MAIDGLDERERFIKLIRKLDDVELKHFRSRINKD